MASSVTAAQQRTVFIPELYPTYGKPRSLGQLEGFLISAASPAGAVILTNPFDTAKVRLQLQGEMLKQELQKATTEQAKKAIIEKNVVYKHSLDTIHKIFVNEGIRGLQKGLTPAIFRESSKNFFRIGMYDPVMNTIHDSSKGSAPAWKRMFAGSLCGIMGAAACNPFELVKTRLQSAAAGKIAVGHQHGYTGVWNALANIYKNDGFVGLYRGSVISMGRSIVGSGTNLAAFSEMKEYLMVHRRWKDDAWLDVVCGFSSSIISVLCMNPIDVVRTRYYNQKYENGKGTLYKTGIDAFKTIIRNEGPRALYKGLIPHFMRIGPHFCFTFLFLGVLRRHLADYYHHLDLKDSFRKFDKDKDGKLSKQDVIPLGIASNVIDEAMNTSDIDKDGYISWSEYPHFASELERLTHS